MINENNMDNMKKIFYVIYLLMISKKVDESNYINILHQLNILGFNLSSINNVEQMIFLLDSNGFKKSYIITMLSYLKCDIYDSILDLLRNYQDLNSNIEENYRNIDVIIHIKNFLKKKSLIIKAFTKIIQISRDELPSNIPKIKQLFEIEQKNEIINRLFQLRKIFNLDILGYMEIELITYEDIVNMNIINLTFFYKKCINNIKEKISNWICLCDAYLDTELSYLKSIKKYKLNNNYKIIFDLDKYDLVIK